MSAVDIAIPQIKHDEGLRLKPYRDTVGKLTVGYGRNLDDVGLRTDEAELMLRNDVAEVVRELAQIRTFRDLDDPRQAVLINMAFNLGMPTLRRFRNMWSALANGGYSQAAAEMLNSRWAQQVGQRARYLAEQMRTGSVPHDG